MTGNGLIESNFPELFDHVKQRDQDLSGHFGKNNSEYGESDREGWLPGSIVQNADLTDFDNIIADRSTVINPVMGNGFRIHARVDPRKSREYQEGLGVKYFSDNFVQTGEDLIYSQDVSPSKPFEALADAYERDIDIYYPGTVEEDLDSALDSLPDYSRIFNDMSRDELKDTAISHMETIGEELNYGTVSEGYSSALLGVAELLDGKTLVLTQEGRTAEKSEDYDVLVQSPEISRQFMRYNNTKG